MKGLLLFLSALGVAGLVAAESSGDSYLYWMVDAERAEDFDYEVVRVKATEVSSGSSQYLNLLYASDGVLMSYVDPSAVARKAVEGADFAGLGFYASLAGAAGENYRYVIELFSSSGLFLAASSELASDQADPYVETVGAGQGLHMASAWRPSSYAAPEPQSGVLAVLGFAVVALLRKKG